MASETKAKLEETLAMIDSYLAKVPENSPIRDTENYKTLVAKRNQIAQLMGLPGIDYAFSASDVLIDVGEDIADIPGEIGDLSLNFVRGLGAALVDGVDGAYDAVRGKLRGKEPDVIAGITVAAITILTVVFLYNGAKNAKDVF